MSQKSRITDTVVEALERRQLFKRAARGAASVAAISALAGTGLAASSTPAAAAGTVGAPSAAQDLAILNFALNLEYLEASYYLYATTGAGLATASTTGVGTAGTVSVPSTTLVPWQTPIIQQLADTIAADEQAHVNFLRTALGAAAVAIPTIDINAAFTTLAVAAGIIPSGQTFSPFASENYFLLGAYIFEDVGVTAYAGAAAAIMDPAYLTAAAQILSVEAYHSGTVRTLLALRGGGTATDAVSALRSTLTGAGVTDDFGTLDSNGIAHLAPLDNNALAFTRTPTQVLQIVYGNTMPGTAPFAVKPGLFFPNGMNGVLN